MDFNKADNIYSPPLYGGLLPPSVFLWDMYVNSIKKSSETKQIPNIISAPFPEDDN